MTLNGIILGAPKCATTSLYHYFQQHPDIECPMPKEGHFLMSHLFEEHGYASPVFGAKFNLDVGTSTAYHQGAIERLAREYPEAKSVLILRNPVDLCISLHSQRTKTGGEHRPLPAALDDASLAAVRRETNRPGLPGYLQAAQLAPVIAYCKELLGENLLILHYEDFKTYPQAWMQAVLRHFGLKPFEFDLSSMYNLDVRPKSEKIHHFLRNPPRVIAGTWGKLPISFRNAVGKRLDRMNQRKHKRQVSASVQRKLERKLKLDVQAVAEVPCLTP